MDPTGLYGSLFIDDRRLTFLLCNPICGRAIRVIEFSGFKQGERGLKGKHKIPTYIL